MVPLATPKISIITPVLNGGNFIESCIRNVCEQDCQQLEHLIVDGGSTDRTIEIVRGVMARCPHIHLYNEIGLNQSQALNKGISLAQGEIIGILNVDDYYEVNVLNRILEFFEDLPEPAFLVGNCNVRDAQDKIIEVNKPRRLRLRDLLIGNQFNPHPVNPVAYFYHKSLHRLTGLYRTNEEYGMDLDFILKAVHWAHVKYVDETWGNFRFAPGTKTYNDFNGKEATAREKRISEPFFLSLGPFDKIYVHYFQRLLQYKLEKRGEILDKIKGCLIVKFWRKLWLQK